MEIFFFKVIRHVQLMFHKGLQPGTGWNLTCWEDNFASLVWSPSRKVLKIKRFSSNQFCLLVKTSYPLAENVNETPVYMCFIYSSWLKFIILWTHTLTVTAVKSIVYSSRSTRETLDTVRFTIRKFMLP